MRRLSVAIIGSCALTGCVAAWGNSWHIESQDSDGGAIRYDHVVISERAVKVHAGELCAKYQKVAVVENERYSVVLPGGSIDELTYACRVAPAPAATAPAANTPATNTPAANTPANSASAPAKSNAPSKPREIVAGTGYLVDKAGDVVTDFHVIDGCSSIALIHNQYTSPGTLIATDQANDLAVINGKLPTLEPVKFRSGKPIRAAESVVVIGFPYVGLLSSSPQITTGSVSSLAGMDDDSRFLQISAPIQPGNSGGPVFDLSGNVVGTVDMTLNPLAIAKKTGSLPQNVNFATKSTVVTEFLESKKIPYASSASAQLLNPADVSDAGENSVVLVMCE